MKQLTERYYVLSSQGSEFKPLLHSWMDVYTGLKDKHQEDVVALCRLQVDSLITTKSEDLIKRVL